MPVSARAHFGRILLRRAIKNHRGTFLEVRERERRYAAFVARLAWKEETVQLDIDGRRGARIHPAGAAPGKAILYLHGGGYVTGSIEPHLVLCTPMARAARTDIIILDYRLAPEHPFPAALEDALAAWHWLLAQGYRAEDLVVAGDSAGAGLAAAAVLSLRDAGEALPAAVVCLSPWVDLTNSGQSHILNAAAEPTLRSDVLREWAGFYAPESELRNPLVSPVYADFHGFPPLLVQVGGDDILLDDARRLAERGRAAGAEVTLSVWEGMWHVWQMFGYLLPESRKALDEIAGFVRDKLCPVRYTA
jgi:acetyl esterase/lipase